METSKLPAGIHTLLADLDLLLAEEEHEAPLMPAGPAVDPRDEPETVDTFNAQILAGLVFP
jgi:hypothetical protein